MYLSAIKNMNISKKKPGFTYIETLVSIVCIIVFILGIQQYAQFYVLHKKTVGINNELVQLSSYIYEQMNYGVDYSNINERFINTPDIYKGFTSDTQMIPPAPLRDAINIYGIKIPEFYLGKGIQIIVSRERIEIYNIEYWNYHCIVYFDEFKESLKRCSLFCIES